VLKLPQQHNMEIQSLLKDIGLTDNETNVYLKSFTYGAQPASIIAKRSNLNRATTYSVLKTLSKKGLITQSSKPEGTYYSAKEPEAIINYLDERKNNLENKKELLLSHIEDLKSVKKIDVSKPKVTFYEGFSGIKQIHSDILLTVSEDTILEFIPENMIAGELDEFIMQDFSKQRIERKIFAKIIAPASSTGYKIHKEDKNTLRETRLVPQESCDFDSEITIYKDKVALISYKQEEIFGIIIESPSISKTLRKIFFLSWDLGQSFLPAQEELFG